MNSLQSSLYTAALALWIFSSRLLRERSRDRGISISYFSIFLTAESAGLVFELLMAHPQIPLKALWLGLRMATSLTIAPVLWLALREVTEARRPTLASLGRVNIGLVLGGAALTLPLMGSAHLGVTYYNLEHPTSVWHSRIIHGTMLGCIAIFAWQAPFYLWRCRQLLLQQFSIKQPTNLLRELGGQTWLHLPLLVVFTTWVLGLSRTIHCISHAPQGFGLLFSVADVSVTVGAIYTMVRRTSSVPEEYAASSASPPEYLFTAPPTESATATVRAAVAAPAEPIAAAPVAAEPIATQPAMPSAATELPAVAESPESKYAKSFLPAAVRERIKRKLHEAFVTRKVYRDGLLNLRSLSAALKENAHYVSQVINQDFNSNFYQLVSHHRIEHAKKLLIDRPDQTVLEIALSVGFNSKSTFNTAFRRNTGTTPREFRERAGLNDSTEFA